MATFTRLRETGEGGVASDGVTAAAATITLPYGVATDPAGNVYYTDEALIKVRKVSPGGTLTTAAGNGLLALAPASGVPATTTPLNIPQGLAWDSAGNLYIADVGLSLVRKVSPAGIISTVAGNGTVGFSGDNGPALSAALSLPIDVAVDVAGTIYIADSGNFRVRKVTRDGVISTVAGNGDAIFAGEGGPARSASLSPSGLALDSAGNLFIADPTNHRILKLTTTGTLVTAAGNGQSGSVGDGGPPTQASLNTPHGVTVDSKGNIYIADSGNNRIRVVLSAPASFNVSADSLTLKGKSTGAATAATSLQIAGSVPGLPFNVVLSTTAGGQWLKASLTNGTMPRNLEISADPATLQSGTWHGTVTIRVAGAQPAERNVDVTLTVESPDPPSLSVGRDAISFSVVEGQTRISSVLSVGNSGGGRVNVAASANTRSGGGWLAVSPANLAVTASQTSSLTIKADPTGLVPGTYLGEISVSGSTGQNVIVQTTLIVSAAKQKMLLTSSGFTFQAVAGGGVIPPQSFGIANAGDGDLNWRAAGSSARLALSRTSGTSVAEGAPNEVVLRVNPASLTPGVYYDYVTITAPEADNAPQLVSAIINVLPADASPGPVLQPSGLLFTAVAGGVSPGSQIVSIYNAGTEPFDFNSNRLTLDGNNWLVHLPSAGTVNPQSPVQIVVQPNLTGLNPGIYSGVVTFLFSGQTVRTLNLLFVVAPSAPVAAGVSLQNRVAACAPTKLAVLLTSLAGGFAGPAAGLRR